ncbi:MAG: hypothetical protein KAH21_08650, partial [Spirochaetaceae bacterium]|nr:hypothetical protein [Spirochaetaceae bacterium]
GYWRGFIKLHSEIAQLDLFSGEVMKRTWEEDIPESLYPASDGNLLVFNPGEAALTGFNSEKIQIETNIPPVSILAVSTEMPLTAWQDGRSNDIHIAGYGAEFSEMNKKLSWDPPWSMSWAGRMLVLAYSGKLYAIDKPEEENPVIYKLEDERLPERWYRIRGESGRLVIQSPEAGITAVISVLSTKISDTDDSNRDFTELLRKSALTAGDKLEASGNSQQAERYYGWILPYIRESRSRYPLEEIWANLESKITQRRTALR